MSGEAHERVAAFLARVPYVGFLGMEVQLAGGEATGVLPFQDRLIGNTTIPSLHGGMLGAFMELTALAQLVAAVDGAETPRTIDMTVEYLRAGRPLATYARAELRKTGRRIANIHVRAWQERRDEPVATLAGHFLL